MQKTHKKTEQPQEGWNCFDIAVGLSKGNYLESPIDTRNKFVAFALDNAHDEQFRKLLSEEIKAAFMVSETHNFQHHQDGLPTNMLTILTSTEHSQNEMIQNFIYKYSQLRGAIERLANAQTINTLQEEFDKCFETEEIYKLYVTGYYKDQHDWFVCMNNNSDNHHCIIDIVAKYLNKNINMR